MLPPDNPLAGLARLCRVKLLRGRTACAGAVVTALVAGAVVVIVSDAVRQQVVLSVVKQPERYTELYFAERGPVLIDAPSSGLALDVPFAVVNHEGEDTAFRYVVQTVNAVGATLDTVDGSVYLTDGERAVAKATIEIDESPNWWAVDVSLADREERIRYLRSYLTVGR